MDIKKIYESKNAHYIFFGLCALILGLLIFEAGVLVGFKKAEFSEELGGNYYRAFGPAQDRTGGFFREDVAGGHGASGKIVRINLPTFVVSSPDNTEKVILINDDTLIRRFRDEVEAEDMTVNDFAVVLGTPDTQGHIVAKLVRLLPQASPSPTPTATPSPLHQ